MENKIEVYLITGYTWFSVFGPILNYLPQYLLIEKNKNIGSFSISISINMVLSSILRMIYFIGHRYDFCLFAQSALMLVIQYFLVSLYFKYKENNQKNSKMKIKLCIIIVTFFSSLYLFLFIYFKSQTFVEVTGTLSALIESFLPIP